MASSSLWAAISQVATIGIQGVAALVILLVFGKGVDTDAVFAAYGLYGVIVLMCQTLRLTVVARLMEGSTPWEAFDRFLGAGLGLVLVAITAELISAERSPACSPAGSDSTRGHRPHDARHSLHRRGRRADRRARRSRARHAPGVPLLGLAYVLGGAMAIVALVALEEPLGIKAAPVGVAVGAVLTAATITARLWQLGYRPRPAPCSPGCCGRPRP